MVTTIHEGKRDKRDASIAHTAWDFSNFTEDVSINCDSATNDELADALATLVGQLMEQGILIGTVKSA